MVQLRDRPQALYGQLVHTLRIVLVIDLGYLHMKVPGLFGLYTLVRATMA